MPGEDELRRLREGKHPMSAEFRRLFETPASPENDQRQDEFLAKFKRFQDRTQAISERFRNDCQTRRS